MGTVITKTDKTDTGVLVTVFRVVGHEPVVRRDDLRGVWEHRGQFYPNRQAAVEAASDFLVEHSVAIDTIPDDDSPDTGF